MPTERHGPFRSAGEYRVSARGATHSSREHRLTARTKIELAVLALLFAVLSFIVAPFALAHYRVGRYCDQIALGITLDEAAGRARQSGLDLSIVDNRPPTGRREPLSGHPRAASDPLLVGARNGELMVIQRRSVCYLSFRNGRVAAKHRSSD